MLAFIVILIAFSNSSLNQYIFSLLFPLSFVVSVIKALACRTSSSALELLCNVYCDFRIYFVNFISNIYITLLRRDIRQLTFVIDPSIYFDSFIKNSIACFGNFITGVYISFPSPLRMIEFNSEQSTLRFSVWNFCPASITLFWL